jgi:N-acyl-D-aspartate/D-glutamate deacylase
MHDLVIRGGTVVDGTGAPRRVADVALDGERISAVGTVDDRGRRELDAEGLLVTPGFVDIHTHYDGQVSWDPLVTPSSWHGVTSVVMGNCGVGFAPVRPGGRDFLINLMEGVEDIPGSALAEGIAWSWESFPEYLDAIDGAAHAIDVGTQVPHGALRAYVMGERAAADIDATPAEVEEMARLAGEAVAAGALGFTTSRTRRHRAADGSPTPTLTAAPEELLGIARRVAATGSGVFEMVSDLDDLQAEFGMMREIAAVTGRPLSLTFNQHDTEPDKWRTVLDLVEKAQADGIDVRMQVCGRAIGLLLGLESSVHPFIAHPSYRPLARLPLAERVEQMRDPEVRRRILSERPEGPGMLTFIATSFHKLFPLGDPPDYEPPPEASIAALARRRGVPPEEIVYDMLLEGGGRELLYFPLFNYAQGDLEPSREMMTNAHTVLGLSDGGAHCGVICDASMPTSMITHWTRDRTRGPRLDLEWVVAAQTRETAAWVGLHDRGIVAPGMRADLNVIDYDRLRLRRPVMAHDLPAGGRRLVQRAEGYVSTIVAGQEVFSDGEHTGALPGRLIRGPQPAPTSAGR